MTAESSSARVWDAATKVLRQRLIHTVEVTSAAFDRSGTLIVTTSADHAVRLWDVVTGDQIVEYNVGGELVDAAFGVDDKSIVVWDKKGPATRFACDACGAVPQLLARARERVKKRPLTPQENRRFFGAQK